MSDSQFAGAHLRAVREERGLTLRDLSERTRIDTRFLHAIERSDFAPFPARLFAVGFAGNYARALGEPADAIVGEARAHFAKAAAC